MPRFEHVVELLGLGALVSVYQVADRRLHGS